MTAHHQGYQNMRGSDIYQDGRNIRINASYYACGFIRKVLNPVGRKEGEPLTKISIFLQKILLPFASAMDKLLPSERDLTKLHFQRNQ